MSDSNRLRNQIRDHSRPAYVSVLLDTAWQTQLRWREQAGAAAAAYTNWSIAPRTEKEQRFAAYNVALDQEEAAAEAYATSLMKLDRWLPGAGAELL